MYLMPRSQLAEKLFQHVDRLAGLIGPRHLGKPSAWTATVRLIENEFSQAGYVVEHHTYEVQGKAVANLIAEIPGSKRRDNIIVVGAHYDTVATTPGADDNASAVAVLLEVARALQGSTPSCTIRFVAFPCEEPPYFHTQEMGSQAYARKCRSQGERILGMLCLEMLGYYTDEPQSQRLPPGIPKLLKWCFPHRGNFLAAVGNLASWRLLWNFRIGFKRCSRFPLFSIALPEWINAIRLSDNSSFWDQGYPALMLTDTSFLRNPNYHFLTDTPETLDYERMAEVTRGIEAAVRYLSGA
jgi:Zn-dependent M28 family amino/carboxypeptidase